MSSQISSFLDWFAGVGGFRLALEELGLKCVGSCENDKFSRQTYQKNFGHEPEFGDARSVRPGEVPDHDLFCAGFPCQAFSTSGKWKGFRGTEGTLFFDACRIIAARRPHYLLLENVKSILRIGYIDEGGAAIPGTDGWVFYTILESLAELGYDVQWQVLNSRDFGVPQSRERVYIIGNLREEPRPEVFPLECKAVGVAVNAKSRVVRPIGRFHPERKTGRQSGRVWSGDGVAPTLTTSTEIMCIEGKLRKMTPVECERTQGFPDNWTEGVSNTQRYKQIGNAVTIKVIKAIGKRLIKEVGQIKQGGIQ